MTQINASIVLYHNKKEQVTKDIAPFSIVGGVPAKIIRTYSNE